MSVDVQAGDTENDLGCLPTEWRLKSLGDVAFVSSGGTPSRGRSDYWNGEIPWITTSQIDFVEIVSANQFITVEGLKNSAAKILPPGTLLLALYGQGKTRGKVGVLGIAAATNQACAAIEVVRDISTGFLLHFLTSRYDTIRAMSNGGSQDNLNSRIVKDIIVPLPTPVEQSAITHALSDMDAVLAKFDSLIIKKRDLKQAAMQQLLTGRVRLPGFTDEWDVKQMKSLGNTYGGLVGKTKVDFGHGKARYIPFMNVMTGTVIDIDWLEYVNVASVEVQNSVKKGDLFFNGSSETPEEVGFCSVLLQDVTNVYLNSFCFGFRFNTDAKINGLFFAYWFRSTGGRKAMALLAQGATRYNIAKSAFLKLELPQPSQSEQTAIVEVLSDMDAELAALEARLDKTRAIKQGMMQELLTGRIRLV